MNYQPRAVCSRKILIKSLLKHSLVTPANLLTISSWSLQSVRSKTTWLGFAICHIGTKTLLTQIRSNPFLHWQFHEKKRPPSLNISCCLLLHAGSTFHLDYIFKFLKEVGGVEEIGNGSNNTSIHLITMRSTYRVYLRSGSLKRKWHPKFKLVRWFFKSFDCNSVS